MSGCSYKYYEVLVIPYGEWIIIKQLLSLILCIAADANVHQIYASPLKYCNNYIIKIALYIQKSPISYTNMHFYENIIISALHAFYTHLLLQW